MACHQPAEIAHRLVLVLCLRNGFTGDPFGLSLRPELRPRGLSKP